MCKAIDSSDDTASACSCHVAKNIPVYSEVRGDTLPSPSADLMGKHS